MAEPSVKAASDRPSTNRESAMVSNIGTTKSDKKQPDQCGLSDDGVEWVRRKASERKRFCETPPEKQEKYRAILKEIYDVRTIIGKRVDFDPNDLIEIYVEVYKYFASEPMLIEDVQAPITVVGDLHGQLYDLNRIFLFHSRDGKPGYESAKFLFLGDYVDRGWQSLEVITGLFILKILYPDNFILLRGNHEFISVNTKKPHGFISEITDRYEDPHTAASVFETLNSVFAFMSICAIIGGKIFCVHGGISTNGFTMNSLRSLRKPITCDSDNALVCDLVWADPAEELQGSCFNNMRQTSIYFGEDLFAQCMHNVDCIAMIRGHSKIDDGYASSWDRCITIFSCTAMGHSRNKGSFAMLDEKLKMTPMIIDVDENRRIWQMRLHGVTEDQLTVADDDTGPGKIVSIKNVA